MIASAYPIAANGALYDPAQANEFVAMLFRHVDWQPGQCLSILGIGEKGTDREGVIRDRHLIAPGFMGAMHSHLKRWAEWHVAGFIVPAVLHAEAHEGKGGGALDKVAALTAIILDIDSGDVTAKADFVAARLGRPSMIVASGGKTEAGKMKAHLYYLLSEPCEDAERVAALRKTLAAKVGGDQSFGRATQVIRIPGSVHAKNGNATVCRILDRCDADYDLDDLADIIENMAPMPGLPAPAAGLQLPMLTMVGGMDFTPRQDTAVAAMHRDVAEGGEDLTRWSEFSKVAGFHIAEARSGRITPAEAYSKTQGWMLTHMNPVWPAARFEQEFRGLFNKDVATHGPFPQSVVAKAAAEATGITPTPASWPIGQAIPPRPWVFGHWAQRGIVTAVVAPGGVGKSSLMTGLAMSLASGQPFLGKEVFGGPKSVWQWNLEDSGDNLARGRVAASMHHGITEAACGGRLFVDSGPEGAQLCLAVEDRTGFTIIEPVAENITAAIIRMGIDVLIIDPFVSSHQVNENDNNKIDAVAKRWARIAKDANCAIILVHHSTKMHGERVTADSSRGAGALNNAARVTLVLNRMAPEQAEAWDIDPVNAARYFSVADDKHNLAPAEGADWFQIVGVSLNNGTAIHQADNVGVVTKWSPPRVMDGVAVSHLFSIQKVLHANTYWKSSQAKDGNGWAGHVVAEILELDADDAKDKKRITQLLAIWERSGALVEVKERNHKGTPKPALKVGQWAGDPDAYRNLPGGQ